VAFAMIRFVDNKCFFGQIPVAIDVCIPLLADSSVKEKMVHIDAFTAMSGVSRFCENEYPWRYVPKWQN